ncbi:metal-binding protein [Roseibium aquae]|uniref:Metal-binding protein n=1 Tax=Roseibium aquae TaxID=1323746 RepID=A0A916TP75_9HYPH|nr:DUF177 domain-containing protein [Roseibium aquae]GGB56652.1 metal-binding protein [Roseibium aquae]
MSDSLFPYSYCVEAERVASTTGHVRVEPSAEARTLIARRYELEELPEIHADLKLTPWRKAGIRVTGTLHARLIQKCGVTLETFEQKLADGIDRTFEPLPKRPRKDGDLNDDGEIELQLDSIDPPDVIENGRIDLGAVLCEQLALNIDPFPRKPGVAFETALPADETADETVDGRGEGRPSPFAVLAKLKDGPAH